jgi:fermentation-respiration switch protein FrsA (DUF1100 family)
MHGTADEVVPFSMSHEIFAACNTRKRMHVVENALHKDMYERDGDALVRSVSEFIAELA